MSRFRPTPEEKVMLKLENAFESYRDLLNNVLGDLAKLKDKNEKLKAMLDKVTEVVPTENVSMMPDEVNEMLSRIEDLRGEMCGIISDADESKDYADEILKQMAAV